MSQTYKKILNTAFCSCYKFCWHRILQYRKKFPMHQLERNSALFIQNQAKQTLATPTTLNISFSEPFSGGSKITNYTVQYRMSGGSYTTLSASMYSIYVRKWIKRSKHCLHQNIAIAERNRVLFSLQSK